MVTTHRSAEGIPERITPRPDEFVSRPARAFALLGVVQVTLIVTITLVAVPLPAIGRELDLTASDLILVSAAYGLSFSGLLLFGGRLADRYGGRRVFLAGLAVFAVASALAPAASGFVSLAGARFGQGIGAALIAPAALVLLHTVFPDPGNHASAMATWGGLSVLGATAGMVLSGATVTWVSWRWLFVVPLSVAGLAMLLTRSLLPAGRPGAGITLDLRGVMLATSGLTSLSYGLVITGDRGWSSMPVLVSLGAGLVLLAGFAVVELQNRDPLLPPAFLADRRRAAALVVIALSAAATATVSLFLALYLQQILGASPLRTSAAFVPYALALIAAGRVAKRMVDRFGSRSVVLAGLMLACGGLILLAGLDAHSSYVTGLLPGLLLLPTGVALCFAGASVRAVTNVPRQLTGLGAGVLNTAMELGPTVGLAFLAAIANARSAHLADTGTDLGTAVTSGYAWAFGAIGLAFGFLAVLFAITSQGDKS